MEQSISDEIFRSFLCVGQRNKKEADELAKTVCGRLHALDSLHTPSREEVQDEVIKLMLQRGHAKTAIAYILNRQDTLK